MKKKGIALVERQYLFPFVLITSLFFLWGFAHAILDVLNKHFQELLTITRTHSAMIQATMYMGYFIMAIPAGLFINRHGYRKGVVLGLLNRLVVVHSRTIYSFVQYVPVLVIRHRMRTNLPGNGRQSVCDGVGSTGNGCQPTEFRSVIQRAGMYLCTDSDRSLAFLRRRQRSKR